MGDKAMRFGVKETSLRKGEGILCLVIKFVFEEMRSISVYGGIFGVS